MDELKRTSLVAEKLLEENEDTRKDDLYLYEEILDDAIPGTGKLAKKIHDLMRAKKLPKWETMRRSRQKIQQNRPELKNAETARHRYEKEVEYREFVRE